MIQYWMKFYDNSDELVVSVSDVTFLGKSFNLVDIKERFNRDFVKGTAKAVELSFLGLGANKTFLAGIRDNKVVIIDTKTKQEYSSKEFSQELNVLEAFLANRTQLQGA